ncbi:glycoside hydrolase family 97 protein [Flavobacterium sp. ENC]|uniref:glycoside hydrolase family 97 protein n=1 Tax=Flavobacterium sp. ENC TaxID=2897330 RepID=UPI001E2D9326|nr:glycoside hydrolase family 97 protein [Flavobacterium sp. ENC]MCD0465274.1 glycoside hydrolase family 97 protein [Flavobacterium sp. ENC]
MKRSITFLFFILSSLIINAQEIISPNGKIKVILNLSDKNAVVNTLSFKALYKIENKFVEVLPDSKLGINRADEQFTDNLNFVSASKPVSIHDKYKMVCGKRQLCENSGTEKTFSFQNSNQQPMNIVFRVYNDGVAFRYVFPNHLDSQVAIINEATTYVLPYKTSCWMQPFNLAYEDFYPLGKTGLDIDKYQEWGFPALYKVNDQPVWGLISEANITANNCAAKLSNLKNTNQYQVTYPSARDNFQQTGVKTTLPWNSQWHTLIIGKLSDIVGSTLISDVSDPSQLKDTEWIKPGAVSWIYWANNHGSKDYKKVVEYVDLAVEMNWPYVLIDWEWDVMSNGGNITDAVNYAKSKGIKPLMWYNSGTIWLDPTPNDRLLTAEKRAKEFSWLNKIGVYGIKVDFFAGDQQDMMNYYIDILKDAAKYHLLVNFHGATVPRGWSRTYPNLMTTEAVYGAEWYNNNEVLTDKAAAHNTTLPFTRNVIGSMDYTPVTFSDSQHPHITSYAHELALSVVFESGFQHFADKPSAYESLPPEPKDFLKHVPVAWDDTRLIDGYPGEKVIIARKKGDKWYIAGINGKNVPQTLLVKFDFIDKGNYSCQLIKDGKDGKSFSSEIIKVKKGDTLKIECLPGGGFVGSINK